jgi:hypothetical protein
MSTQVSTGEDYIKLGDLAKYLGWHRTTIYYWLARTDDIPVVELAGIKMIKLKDLPWVLIRLRQVKEEAKERYK